jgi:hypothetical protein
MDYANRNAIRMGLENSKLAASAVTLRKGLDVSVMRRFRLSAKRKSQK